MLQIRKSTYRGRPGYLLCGKPRPGSYAHWRIFTRTRAVARAIRQTVQHEHRGSIDFWSRVRGGLLLAERSTP